MRRTRRFAALFAIALVAGGSLAALAPVGAPAPRETALRAPIAHATSHDKSAPTPAASKPTTAPAAGAGTTNTSWFDSAANTVFGWLFANIAALFAWLLGVAALTLDTAVYYTIVHMGDFVNNVKNVGVAWRVLRDIGNIALIFGFVFAGIAVILNSEYFGFGSKMLPKLLLAAVLLNFSLFISMAIIDVGNLFATEIYAQINNGTIPGPKEFSGGYAITNEGISNRIMSVLGLQSIYHPKDATGKSTTIGKSLEDSALMSFMAMLLFLVATFVFFSLAFMVVARFVALIFLMIVAPIGFAGLAIPKLQGLASKWWSMLAEQTLVAPVLMLLLYIALAVITDGSFLACAGLSGSSAACKGTGNLSNQAASAWATFQSPKGVTGGDLQYFAGIILVFVIAMALLLAVVIAAKQMSAFGASWATKMGGRLSFGLTAYGASALANSAGRAGRFGAQRFAPNSRLARFATRYAFRPMENANLDMVRIPGVKAGAKMVGVEPIAKSPGQRLHQYSDWRQKSTQEANQKYSRETAVPRMQAAIAAGDMREVGRIAGGFSDKDLETPEVRRALRTPEAVAALSQSKFDKRLESDQIPDSEKANLRTQRNEGLRRRYADTNEWHHPQTGATKASQNPRVVATAHAAGTPVPNMTQGEQAVRALSNEDASKLPDSALIRPEVYGNLTTRQLEAIRNRGAMDDSNAATIGAHLATDPTFVAFLGTRNPQQTHDIKTFWHIP